MHTDSIRPSFSAQVRRKLILRLGMLAVCLSLVLGIAAWFYEKRRTEKTIVNLAVEQALFFDVASRADGSAAGVPLDEALVQEFRKFLQVSPQHSMGSVVFARLYNREGRLLTAVPQAGPEIEALLDASPDHLRNDLRVWHRQVKISGVPHVLIGGPLHDADGTVVAHAEGVVSISAAALAELRRNLLLTTAAVVLIVLGTSAAVYPIAMRLTHRLVVLSGNLLQANIDTAQVLGSAIAKRDSDTSEHNFRVTIISVRIAEAYGLDATAVRNLIKGAFVHDVGKIAISDNILLKPGRLTRDEFEVMKTHVQQGVEIVERSNWLSEAVHVVQHHHEKFDGSGYLHGLSGEEIPISARIFCIADVFDALTSRRPYKEPMGYDRAMAVLEDGRGTHFDPELLDAFVPIAPQLYMDLIENPREEPGVVLRCMVRRYFSHEASELRL